MWADVFLGGSTAILGLLFTGFFTDLFGIGKQIIAVIAAITLLYALFALLQVTKRFSSIAQIRILLIANWCWTIVSLVMLVVLFDQATKFGVCFLVAQVMIVGGLAYLEGAQLSLGNKSQ